MVTTLASLADDSISAVVRCFNHGHL